MNPVRLSEIAELIGAALIGDSELSVNGVSSIESQHPGTVLYVDDMSNLKRLVDFFGRAVIVPESPQGITGNFLVHPKPRVAFAKVSAFFHHAYWLEYAGKCPAARIEDGAKIADTATIGAHSFIGSGSIIKDNVRVLPLVFIGRNVVVGRDTVILPGAVILDDTKIGERVIINSNAVIGSEGFGFLEDEGELVKVPQMGRVIIEDDVEVGACVTIDRGTIDDTIIGHGTRIDNLVQIGHNVQIGRNVRIAAQAGFSGRVKIDDNVIVGGQVGFQNGVEVGKGVRIAGQTAVFKSIAAGQTVSGYPAMPHGQALRLLALTRRLPEIMERLDTIEKKLMEIDL